MTEYQDPAEPKRVDVAVELDDGNDEAPVERTVEKTETVTEKPADSDS